MDAALAVTAIASPRRREILRLVWRGERSAGEIAAAMPEVTFGAVSQHLAVLTAAGAVARRGEGRRRYYQARRESLGALAAWLESTWDDALARLALHAEAEAARRGPRPARRRRRRRKGSRP